MPRIICNIVYVYIYIYIYIYAQFLLGMLQLFFFLFTSVLVRTFSYSFSSKSCDRIVVDRDITKSIFGGLSHLKYGVCVCVCVLNSDLRITRIFLLCTIMSLTIVCILSQQARRRILSYKCNIIHTPDLYRTTIKIPIFCKREYLSSMNVIILYYIFIR